jgi:hypothetical protein
MSLQIKGKFISNEAVDGSKIKLRQGEALRAIDENGIEIELLKIGPNGEVLANGDELAFASDLDAEVIRAQAAEAALQAEIDAEEAARIAAVSAEASARESADSVLQANIDAEAAARAAAVSAEAAARTSAIAAEASAREAADSALQANIDAEAAARAAAVSAEAASRASADSALSGRLDTLEGNAAVEGSVAKAEADAKAYADQKIADLVASAPEVLDTLKELSDALGGDANFAATVAGQIGSLQAEIDAEELARAAAVSAEASAREAAVAAVQAEVDAEESRALAAEAALSASISAESAARSAAISAEASAREAADSSLQSNIDAEAAARAAAVSAEASARQAADAVLQASITALEESIGQSLADQVAALETALSAEEAARAAADSTLTSNLAAEVSRAQAAEAALQSELDAEEARAAAAEAALAQDIADEESARIAAVAAEAAARTAADSALQGSIDAEVAARAAAVSSEASARAAADSTLQSNIDAEAAARVAGDAATLASANSYTDAQVAALVDSAPALLNTLKELSDALGGDENFATTVASNIAAVQAEVDAEEVRAAAAEATLQANIDAEAAARAAAVSAEEVRALAAEALKVNKAGDTITGELIFQNADLKVKNPSGQTVAHFDASESSAVFGVVSADTLSTEMAGGAIKVEAGVNLGGAQTFIGAGFINLQESNGSAAMPTLGKHAASKAYVDQEVSAEASARASTDSAHNSRISALEAREFRHVKRTLTSTDISNGYITLDHVVVPKSIVASVGRLMIHEGATEDFTVSTVGGASRLTFLNSLVHPGNEALSAGDVVYVKYLA